MKKISVILLTVLMCFLSGHVFAKKEVTRQMGGACGEDDNIVASCASGLHCEKGSCALNSYLSPAVVGCKQAMKDKGVNSKEYVASHDGFCYIDSDCRGLYEAAMGAANATPKVVKADGSIDQEALSGLPEHDRQAFEHAVDMCKACGHCTIGRGFLGRGGY